MFEQANCPVQIRLCLHGFPFSASTFSYLKGNLYIFRGCNSAQIVLSHLPSDEESTLQKRINFLPPHLSLYAFLRTSPFWKGIYSKRKEFANYFLLE